MLIDLKSLFLGEMFNKDFNCDFSMQDVDIEGNKPFVSPINVSCNLKSKAGGIELVAEINFDYHMPCDRCTEDFSTHQSFKVMHILTREDCENEDDYYVTVGDVLDTDLFFYEEVILNIPQKNVCTKDCFGLCPVCGANKNKVECNCEKGKIDPRLEVLKSLIKD